MTSLQKADLTNAAPDWLNAAVDDLKAHQGTSLVIAGDKPGTLLAQPNAPRNLVTPEGSVPEITGDIAGSAVHQTHVRIAR